MGVLLAVPNSAGTLWILVQRNSDIDQMFTYIYVFCTIFVFPVTPNRTFSFRHKNCHGDICCSRVCAENCTDIEIVARAVTCRIVDRAQVSVVMFY